MWGATKAFQCEMQLPLLCSPTCLIPSIELFPGYFLMREYIEVMVTNCSSNAGKSQI